MAATTATSSLSPPTGPTRVSRLRIWGFRGIEKADLRFNTNAVLIGPNGCGKSTLVDALSLAFGRTKMVRILTEHDFTGGDPKPEARIRIVVTLAGFSTDDSDDHDEWFRHGRGIPKWALPDGTENGAQSSGGELVANLGFAARFDHDDLEVESTRYFHDDDDASDPFDDEGPLARVPTKLLNDTGFFVLPARRSWDAVASFSSDLFRRTVSNAAGIPAQEVLDQRDLLRKPAMPIEDSPKLADLVSGLNDQLARLVLGAPKFQLRVTAGDSEAVLQALLPHYQTTAGPGLPAARHGSGLVSLQSLLLLLEVGRARKAKGLPFILALEEPELHLAPGLHGRMIAESIAQADQVLCTTHSPAVAHAFDATATLVVNNEGGTLTSRALLGAPLPQTATSNERKFFIQNRARVVEALMYPFVLVPEGRFDCEWLVRLANVANPLMKGTPPFTAVFGLVPTENAAIEWTLGKLRPLRSRFVALVDGDSAGDGYVTTLLGSSSPPEAIVQWPSGFTIEDVVAWILGADEPSVLGEIQKALAGFTIGTVDDLRDLLRRNNDAKKGIVGLKEDVLAHEIVIGEIERSASCRARLVTVYEALVSVATGPISAAMVLAPASTATTKVYRFQP